MEMEEENGSPFWVESSRRRHRGRRLTDGVASFFFSSGLLITILLLTAIAFLFFVIPSTISLTSQIFRPNNVKKSWDSINLILVVFALIFGFLSRNKNQDRNDGGFPADVGGLPETSGNGIGGGLRRNANSSSYPDLLEASPKLSSVEGIYSSYDDMRIYSSRFSGEGIHRRRSWKYAFDDGDGAQLPEIKDPFEDTFMASPEKPPPPVAPPSPPPAPPSATAPPPPEHRRERRRKKRDVQAQLEVLQEPISEPAVTITPPSPPPATEAPPEFRRERRRKKRDAQPELHQKPISETAVEPPSSPPYAAAAAVPENIRPRRRKRMDNHFIQRGPISEPVVTPPPPPPPPPSPPPPPPPPPEMGRSEKKRSGGNATKDFLNSFYHKKKKKQRQKSVENFDALLHQSQIPPLHYQLPPPSPPPAPPPPPPPSVFHTLFSSKKSRRKSIISVPIPPPVKNPATYAGEESLLRRIPPPPPPPPPPFLKSPAWRFLVQGDFVRVDSYSSRSGSPEMDEEMEIPTASDGGDTTSFPASPLFFPPSPDVDSKADNFINRFRAGLKLEKMNSMNNRGVGRSNLGPTQN